MPNPIVSRKSSNPVEFSGGGVQGGGGGGGTVGKDDVSVNTMDSNAQTTASTTVTIGSDTKRKVIAPISLDDDAGGVFNSPSVTFDPGGGDEVSGVQITGAAVAGASNHLHTDAFYMDIPDGVSAGTYTVQVVNGEAVSHLGIAAHALFTATAGQPEAVETDSAGSSTSLSTTITTLTDGAMVCDHVIWARNVAGGGVSPDDGQTKEYEDFTTQTTICGSTLSVESAGVTNTGWSWSDSTRYTQMAISVAPDGDGGGGEGGEGGGEATAVFTTDFSEDTQDVDLTTYAGAPAVLEPDYCNQAFIQTAGTNDPKAQVIDDPTNPGNPVLHIHGGFRVQWKLEGMHVSNNPTFVFTSRQRMYLHTDFNGIFDPPMEGSAKIAMWQEIRVRPNNDPKSRILLRWHANQGTGTIGWDASLWDASVEEFWEDINDDDPPPIGQWFELITRFQAGDSDTGRVQVVMIPEGGSEQIIHDVHDWTDNPSVGAGNARSIQDWNPQKQYSPNEVSFNHLQSQGKDMQYYVDWWEFYQDWVETF